MLTEALELAESKRLIALESVISKGQKTFVEVGEALAEIRDSKLYRSDHKTFEDYCQSKWGWKKAHAYRTVDRNKVRTVGDQLALRHNCKNGNLTAAICATLACIASNGLYVKLTTPSATAIWN